MRHGVYNIPDCVHIYSNAKRYTTNTYIWETSFQAPIMHALRMFVCIYMFSTMRYNTSFALSEIIYLTNKLLSFDKRQEIYMSFK